MKRSIAKAKTYGFNPWADQIDALSVIMTKTGAREATILRKLVDEALVAHRLREAEVEIEQTTGAKGIADALETIQTLLMKLVKQGDTCEPWTSVWHCYRKPWPRLAQADELHGRARSRG
jgi:hypothetical protein